MPLVNCGLLVDYSTRDVNYLCHNESDADVDYDHDSRGAPSARVGRLSIYHCGKVDTNVFESEYG